MNTTTLENEAKYVMSMSLNVLNHLGLNLYSNIPAVLSEVVANAYDADATRVDITYDTENGIIQIKDNGHGMDISDINKKFLYVGYERRENGENITPVFKRPVMGRKGIGKLSLFSIAKKINIHTAKLNEKTGQIEKNAFLLDRNQIVSEIRNSKDGKYYPTVIDPNIEDNVTGTHIYITDFIKNISYSVSWLKKRLAKRFSVIGTTHQFQVYFNNEPITIEDRDFFKKVQFFWQIGEDSHDISKKFSFERVNHFDGIIEPNSNYTVSGWIGTVKQAGDLNQDNTNNNKISIISRGKMAQEDILESYNEGGIYSTYLIGEIHADFLDDDDKDDIATSSRQKINEEDPRYLKLQSYIYTLLKRIQKIWTELRVEVAEEMAVVAAEQTNPSLKIWFDNLKSDARKKHAIKLFGTIETLHFDAGEAAEKKKELYKQGILAFEKLKLRDSLHELENIKTADDIKLAAVFSDLSDIEANLFYDIATERVGVIKQFQKQLDDNDKEKLLQKYLFDNLWLLNPSWERPTTGTEQMETRVYSEFNSVFESLTEAEKNARMDIKYRTAAGKHVIVELKRYKPNYQITLESIQGQIRKYRDGLRKCLVASGAPQEPIEIVVVLGSPIKDTNEEDIANSLKVYTARVVYYDTLIAQSLASYSEYLEKQKEVSKLRAIIDSL